MSYISLHSHIDKWQAGQHREKQQKQDWHPDHLKQDSITLNITLCQYVASVLA